MNKCKYTQEDVVLATKMYEDGIILSKIAKEINVSESTLFRMFEKNNVIMNRNTYKLHNNENDKQEYDNLIQNKYIPFMHFNAYNYVPKYNYQFDYFDNINNQDKAYILGLLYADGNMHKSHNSASITLQEKDVDILKKINKLIKSNKELVYTKKEMKIGKILILYLLEINTCVMH